MGEREEYYDRRAAEYDESITAGLDAETAAAFARESAALGRVLAAVPPGRVLDVACGTARWWCCSCRPPRHRRSWSWPRVPWRSQPCGARCFSLHVWTMRALRTVKPRFPTPKEDV